MADIDAIVNEVLDSMEKEASGEATTKEAEAQETAPEAEASEETQPQGEAEAEAQDNAEDVEEEPEKGKAIPYEAFKKKNEKWKKRYAEAEKRIKELEERGKPVEGLSAEDNTRYQNLQRIFGNLTNGAKSAPFIEDVLVSLAEGKAPDWNKVSQALTEWNQNRPTVDPRVEQKLQELDEFKRNFQLQQEAREWSEQLSGEVSSIKTRFGSDVDDTFIEEVKRIAAGEAAMLPENSPKSAYPSLTKIAERIYSQRKAWLDAKLKSQTKVAPKKSGANLNNGNGPAASKKFKMPDPTSQEFVEKMQDPEFVEWLTNGNL